MANIWNKLPQNFCALAPMEDVTDTVFRRIVTSHGRPDLFFSEFTSAEGLCSPGRVQVSHRLKFTEDERPLIAQLWAVKPEAMKEAAKIVADLGFDGIDINMGCPVPKIVKNGACSALIDNPDLASKLIESAKQGGEGLPVSVKTRCGFKNWKTTEWVTHLLGCDIAALTLHGRIAAEQSKYPARWDQIQIASEIRDEVAKETIIIGNGDVVNRSHGVELCKSHKLDGVMIGRGVFSDLCAFGEQSFSEYSKAEKLQALMEHVELFMDYWEGEKNFRVLKKFFKIYIHGFENAAKIRDKLVNSENYQEFNSLISQQIKCP